MMNKDKRQKIILGILLFIAIIVIILLLLVKCEPDNHSGVIDGNIIERPTSSDILVGDTDLLDVRVTFGGQTEYDISADSPNIVLYNLIKNKIADNVQIYMRFEIYYNETLICTTDAVPPGMSCYINLYSYFSEIGSYDITIIHCPVDPSTGAIYNGINQPTKLTVN